MTENMLDYLLNLSSSHDEDAETEMVAILRNEYLDVEAVSLKVGYDISDYIMTDPKFVLYYLAIYIEMLQEIKM